MKIYKNCKNELPKDTLSCHIRNKNTKKKTLYRKWWLWTIVVIIIIAIASVNNNEKNIDNNIANTITNNDDYIKSSKTKTETIDDVTFEIPENWNRTDKENNHYFYTPNGDMFYYIKSKWDTLAFDTLFDEFVTGFCGSFDSAEVLSKENKNINNLNFYFARIKHILDDENYIIEMYVLPQHNNLYQFVISSKGADLKYANEITNILNSLKIDQTNAVNSNIPQNAESDAISTDTPQKVNLHKKNR